MNWDPRTMPLNCTQGYAPPESLETRAKLKGICAGGRRAALAYAPL